MRMRYFPNAGAIKGHSSPLKFWVLLKIKIFAVPPF